MELKVYFQIVLICVVAIWGSSQAASGIAHAAEDDPQGANVAVESPREVVADQQEDVSGTTAIVPLKSPQSIETILANLSLQDFVALIQARNQKIIFSKLDLQISEEMVRHAVAIFDPEFVGSYSHERNKTKNTTEEALARSALADFSEYNNNYSASVEGLVATGGRLTLGYTLLDITNSLQADDVKGKEYKSFVGATLSQPLLKNRGVEVTKAGIHIAEYEQEIAFQSYRHEMIEVTAMGADVYWGLHLANKKYEIRQESVRIAEQILRDNRERVRAGKMAETEVLEAEAGLAIRKALEKAAEQNVVVSQNNLFTLILSSSANRSKDIILTDAMRVEDTPVDFESSLQNAFKYRADYLTSMNRVSQEGIRVAYAKNQDWPELDLNASYGLNGLDEKADSSWNDAFSGDEYKSWSVGMELRIPLGGNKSGSELRAARLRKKQALIELKATEVAVENDIDATIRNVRSAREQVKNYRHAVELNRRLLEVELIRFNAGQSNSRIVLEREDILNTSKEEMLDGLLNLKRSFVELAKAEGSLLQMYGLEKMEVTQDGLVVY